MFHFKQFGSLQWFGFLSIISLIGLLILKVFTTHHVPLVVSFFNVILAGLSLVFIEWPSKDGYSSDRVEVARGIPVILNPADGTYTRFNPVEGKSAEEILAWFQTIVDVDLTAPNYTLAQSAINLHLINNPAPSVKSVLDELEALEPLTAFSLEVKKSLFYTYSAS